MQVLMTGFKQSQDGTAVTSWILVSVMQVLMTDFKQSQDGTAVTSWLLISFMQVLMTGFKQSQDGTAVTSWLLVSSMQVLMTGFKQSQDRTAVTSWLCLEAVIITCMKLTNAEYTVGDSWWWAEKMRSSQPVYCVDVYRERRYQMLCEYNFSSWRWAG